MNTAPSSLTSFEVISFDVVGSGMRAYVCEGPPSYSWCLESRERIGVEGRGAFYDGVGAIRDVVQNHVLQVVTLLAMEPPVGPSARHLSAWARLSRSASGTAGVRCARR